jgi:S1-C subfamily serine protease
MSDLDTTAATWACASCGRRVPHRVAVCRCGSRHPAARRAGASPATSSDDASNDAKRTVLAVVVVFAVIVGAAFWLRRPPPPVETELVPAASPRMARAAEPVEDPAGLAARSPEPADDRPVTADPPHDPDPEPDAEAAPLEAMVSRVTPAVVQVETEGSRGTAFFVTPDTLLTNVHVVGRATMVTIRRASGATASARVHATSPQFDIAVLKLPGPEAGQTTIPLGSAVDARAGQEVVAIGSALGTLQSTVTRGIVSALRQSGSATLVQTDAAVNPGNSGGPLLDRRGAAIGITTMGYSGRQGLNFAVAAEHARAVLEGRAPTVIGAATTGGDLRPLSPEVASEAEQARANGARQYEQTLAQIGQRAARLDATWRQFRGSCYEGQIAGRFDREWYAVYDSAALPGAVAPGCGGFFDEIKREASAVRDGVISAEEAARRAGVYPGDLREARRTHGLDYPGWDR